MVRSLVGAARSFTRADLHDAPDDGYRREIIGGSLLVTPAPNARHQLAVGALLRVLQDASPEGTTVLGAPFDWELPDGGSVQPDLVVVHRDELDLDGPLPPTARPLLVVEVLSPSNADQDRGLKRALYERLQVPAYWLVDPVVCSLLALRLHDAHYSVEAEVTGANAFSTDWPFPVRVVPTDLS